LVYIYGIAMYFKRRQCVSNGLDVLECISKEMNVFWGYCKVSTSISMDMDVFVGVEEPLVGEL
jgi:hypothetical protein